METDVEALLCHAGHGTAQSACEAGNLIFAQGDPADSVFYIRNGQVKLSVVSARGKEGILALVGSKSFFGENCLVGSGVRMITATAMTQCSLLRIGKRDMVNLIHAHPVLSGMFIEHLLHRTACMEGDIANHLFNNSEKRLARLLLTLASFGNAPAPEPIDPKISHEVLAEMIGTTRPRVSKFMKKFRDLGHIECGRAINVRNSLLDVLLEDDTQS